MITSLSTSNRSMRENIRRANDHLAESLLKIKDLSDDINELRRCFNKKIARVARAARVVDALDQPF